MELYAAGFNALGVTHLTPGTTCGDDDHNGDPTDLHVFTRVLAASHIDPPLARLCHTIVRFGTQPTYTLAGRPDPGRNVDTDAGIAFDMRCVEAANGRVVVVTESATQAGTYDLAQYASFEDAQTGRDRRTFPELKDVVQVVAYEVGFAALTSKGTVYTWGDGRYPDCLGRKVASVEEAESPGLVEDLDGWPVSPIVKIAAGGYTVAALNPVGDLYCWGSPPRPFRLLDDAVGGTPNLVDVNGGEDVVDVALGQKHMLVLTRYGAVFGVGSNSNGQLGFVNGGSGELNDSKLRVDKCTRLNVDISDGFAVTGVSAGPLSSFLLAKAQRKEPRDS